ncbi:MAG: CNNM domain-containing protein [Simkaniaceae bacterium]
MNSSSQLFLTLTLLSVVIHAFFSMLEMSCVSFNKVRLQYYVSQGSRRARWLHKLLQNPTYLFGTTLIGVNTALQFGSECSRRFYASLGVNPDYAPLTQVVIVLIFAELSPMFAARRFSEHVSMLGIPIIYFMSRLFTPVIFLLGLLCRFLHLILKIPNSMSHILSRDEIQKAVEAREEKGGEEEDDLEMISTNIFALKEKTAKDLMEPVKNALLLNSDCTIDHLRLILKAPYPPYFIFYEGSPENIVGIAYARNLIRETSEKLAIEKAITPWFILEQASIMEIIKQFRSNNRRFALCLDRDGNPTGILTLDAIIDEIFCPGPKTLKEGEKYVLQSQIDRTFKGDTELKEIEKRFSITFPDNSVETLEKLMEKHLMHPPVLGDVLIFEGIELIVEDAPLIGKLKIRIRTLV